MNDVYQMSSLFDRSVIFMSMPELIEFFPDIQRVVDEDYPPAFSMEEFNKINSYAGKLRYANTHLIKLASGSGRTVFKVDEKIVLKIAKNRKGVEQNTVESDWSLQDYDLIAKVFERNDDGLYIEMELAKKVGRKRFEQLFGAKIDELADYLTYRRQQNEPRRMFNRTFDPEFIKKMEENELVIELDSINGNYDFATGDEGRLSTWGEVLRDGKPKIVLIDYGLSNSVFNDYYRVELK